MKYSITTRDVAEQPVIVGRRSAPRAGIATAIGEVLPAVFRFANDRGIALTGPPFVRYIDPDPDLMTFEPGMPIAPPAEEGPEMDLQDQDELAFSILPGGTVASTIHVGSYDTLHEAYAAIERWIDDQGKTRAGAPWETYLTDPTSVPDPAAWRTEICWPVS